MEIRLPAEVVKIVRCFASTKDVRFYLNSLYLDIGTEESVLVGTDGNMLGAYRLAGIKSATLIGVAIPLELLAHIKDSSSKYLTEVRVEIGEPIKDSLARELSISFGGAEVTGLSANHLYLQWRRVFPVKVDGKPATYSPYLLSKIGKAIKLKTGRDKPIYALVQNGENGALFNIGDANFIGVIMPVRTDSMSMCSPGWVLPEGVEPQEDVSNPEGEVEGEGK